MMVNYIYDSDKIEAHHQSYAIESTIATYVTLNVDGKTRKSHQHLLAGLLTLNIVYTGCGLSFQDSLSQDGWNTPLQQTSSKPGTALRQSRITR